MCCREFNLNTVPVQHPAAGKVKREGWVKYPSRRITVAVR